MTTKISKLFKYWKSLEPENGFLLPPTNTITYPEIDGNTANFISDYNEHFNIYDRYFINQFGQRSYNDDQWEPENLNDTLENWFEEITGVVWVHLDSWARLYYALNEQYNPLYNVDGTTETTFSEKNDITTYGATSNSDTYGARSMSDTFGAVSIADNYGQKETTNGSRNDSRTEYQVGFDSTIETETGRNSDAIGSQTITEGAQSNSHTEQSRTDSHTEQSRTDTHTGATHTDNYRSGAHTEIVTRFGNIGVTKSTELLESEWEFRKQAFFKWIFEEITKGAGLYYEF